MATPDRTLRLTTSGGIKYALIEGYPKLTANGSGITGEEEIIIKASDYGAFIAESFPSPIVFSTSFIDRPKPRSMGGAGFLVTTEVQAEPFRANDFPADPFGFDPSAPSDTYDTYLRLRISYGTTLDDADIDPTDPVTFLTRTITAGGEFLHISPEKTKAHTDDDNKGQQDTQANSQQEPTDFDDADLEATKDRNTPGAVKTIPTVDVSLKWDFVLFPNWAEILDQLGTVNDRSLALLLNSEVETAMFMGVIGSQKFVWYGGSAVSQPWELTYRFSIRRIKEGGVIYGWNHVWNPKIGKWVKVYRPNPAGTAAAPLPLHPSMNPLDLFKIPL